MALFWTWALIAAVCAASCTVARWLGRRIDCAEDEGSRRQWQLMCEALGLVDLAADADDPPTPSPAWLSPAPPAREPALTEAAR